jgi:hypothetical protein
VNALIFPNENISPIDFYITRFFCSLILVIISVFSSLPTVVLFISWCVNLSGFWVTYSISKRENEMEMSKWDIEDNTTVYQDAVFWLVDERGIFYQFLVFSSFSTIAGVFAKPTRDQIPSLNSLWRHGCNSNFSGFLFQSTLK